MSSRLLSSLRNRFGSFFGRRNPWDDRRDQLSQKMHLLLAHGSRGDHAAGIEQCDEIVSLVDSWKLEAPESADDEKLAFLGEAHLSISQIRRELGQAQSSIEHAQQAKELWKHVSNRYPDDMEAMNSLAVSYNFEGLALVELGDCEGAVSLYDQAIATRQAIRAKQPEDGLNVVYLGGVYCNRGIAEKHMGHFEAALRDYDTAIDILSASIPGCDCGCRDALEAQIEARTRTESPVITALNFLRNSLYGRANLLGPDAELKHIGHMIMRMSPPVVEDEFEFLFVKFNDASLCDDPPGTLNELRLELLYTLFTNWYFVVFDVSAVKSMDRGAIKLLRHLRSQLIGSRRWPTLVGLTPELAESTPEMKWKDDFTCFDSLEHFLNACAAGRNDDPSDPGHDSE